MGSTGKGGSTHTPLDLVFDGLDDPGVLTLTQLLGGTEVVAAQLHLLLLERHHGILHSKTHTGALNQSV